MGQEILSVRDLAKYYYIGSRQLTVLHDINLDVDKGEFVVVAGSSGSGKTTLLSLLAGLDRPSSGRIVLAGRDITDLNEDELAPVRNTLTGFVFQGFHLIPSLNAWENVMFPAELHGDRQAAGKARRLLERVGLEGRLENFPQQLSGGEQQRVAICRALINEPAVVFADEPTGNLDSENGEIIVQLMIDLHRDRDTTLIMATHSHRLAARADRIIRIHDGRLVDREKVAP